MTVQTFVNHRIKNTNKQKRTGNIYSYAKDQHIVVCVCVCVFGQSVRVDGSSHAAFTFSSLIIFVLVSGVFTVIVCFSQSE